MRTAYNVPRSETIQFLLERDGNKCQHPDCNHVLEPGTKGPREVTVDHWFPLEYCRANGWTDDEMWDTNNLKLMCRRCNASKGNMVPNDDGSLPERRLSRFLLRRISRVNRPIVCITCLSGRKLIGGEICPSCGSGPEPMPYPRYLRKNTLECDHDQFYCVACLTFATVPRKSPWSIETHEYATR